MIKKIFASLGFVAILMTFTLVPLDVSMAQEGFVSCNGVDCSFCNLVDMANTIIVWLFGVLFIIFAIIMLTAGFGMITSGGNDVALDAAKKKFQNGIIGIIIIMSAWLLVDIFMKGLLQDGELRGWGPWSEVECQEQTSVKQFVDMGEVSDADGTPPDPSIVAECTDDAALMAKYKGSPVGAEDPKLRTMIGCYLDSSDVSGITDKGQLYTTDRSHPRCSLTNGNPVCGRCSHSNNSKHYGRGSGLGAQAVDFNAKGGSETDLYNKLKAKQSKCGGSLLFEGDHTHISL